MPLVGGLIGAVMAGTGGMHALQGAGVKKIILALLISPVLGTAIGFVFMVIFYEPSSKKSPSG